MCTYSMVGDWGRDRWAPPYVPVKTPPVVMPPQIVIDPSLFGTPSTAAGNVPTAEEWAAFRKLLEWARVQDLLAGEESCESVEKTDWIEGMEERLADVSSDLENVMRLFQELRAEFLEWQRKEEDVRTDQ